MKRNMLLALLAVFVLSLAAFWGCMDKPTDSASGLPESLMKPPVDPCVPVQFPLSSDLPTIKTGVVPCGFMVFDWIAGQTNDVGSVTVYNNGDKLYITVKSDVAINELHGWVGTDPTNIPTGNNCNRYPPGQLPWSASFNPGVMEYTWEIPLGDIPGLYNSDGTITCEKPIYFILHGALANGETAYGGNWGYGIADGGNWWYYGVYYYKCCEPPPPPEGTYQTAYVYPGAKVGPFFMGYVFTTDLKSNPENYDTWRLTKNRWGWGFKFTSGGSRTFDIYAGAGLNKISNGQKVGEATISYSTMTGLITVLIQMSADFSIAELHIYAGYSAPTTIAPGQYPYKFYFGDQPSEYVATFGPMTFYGNYFVVHMVAYGDF